MLGLCPAHTRLFAACGNFVKNKGAAAANALILPMTATKPTFPLPTMITTAARGRDQARRAGVRGPGAEFTPIRRQVLQALLSSHRPLGAYEVIDELAKSMPRAGADHGVSRAGFPDGETASSTALKAATPISPARMTTMRRRWLLF